MVARSRLFWMFQTTRGALCHTFYDVPHFATGYFASSCCSSPGHWVLSGATCRCTWNFGSVPQCIVFPKICISFLHLPTFDNADAEGRVYFPPDTEICTFGFRVTQHWLALNFGTGRARMWNRRYVDFLVKMETLEIPMDPSWPTFLCIRHFQGPYQLVADLNRYFDDPSCRHFRLMHLPLLPQVYRLSYDQPEGWVPLLGATPSTLTRPARL